MTEQDSSEYGPGPDWPVADFDPVRRLRVIAATAPGARVDERVIAAPFEEVWALAQDLERTMPLWVPDVRSVRLAGPVPRAGRVEARIHGHTRLRATFTIDLEPGWCLMQSHFILGGMAAHPLPDGTTRFAFLGAFRLPAGRVLAPLLRPLFGQLGPRSLARFEALFEAP